MNQQKTIKFRIFFSIEKEEQWLETMSAQGWHLVSLPGFVYTFQKGTPEKRIYRIDYRTINKQDQLDDYLSLFEDSQWTCVNPKTGVYNYYFYTTATNQIADIFSDQYSKAQRFHRYANALFSSMFISIIPYFALYATGIIRFSEMGYLTPGLWEMQGNEFFRHFLFETPFVLFRVGCGLFPVFILLFVLYFRIMADLKLRQTRHKK